VAAGARRHDTPGRRGSGRSKRGFACGVSRGGPRRPARPGGCPRFPWCGMPRSIGGPGGRDYNPALRGALQRRQAW